ncbi:MAG TPA: alkaline phosphatase family protein [Polyangia bacterium]|jgi:arylsulfatase A-like enzyme|nr:alkaline phosphatase family protein [Polyangia bacterium]
MSRFVPGLLVAAILIAGCGDDRPVSPRPRVIEIDIDDHGLAGLSMANAPNIKALIARGTLAFSRVIVPTHSNQSNMSLLTGQYPEGDNVPSNSWLSRADDFLEPVALPGLNVGDYVLWNKNPLRTRGDSVYGAAKRQKLRTAYVGPLPPFEAGADDSHLTIIGTEFGGGVVDFRLARALLTSFLEYPQAVVDGYHFEGPPVAGQSLTNFTIRQAAALVRQSADLPDYMFVFDFIALDGDPTSKSGASGPDVVKIIEDYDDAVGELIAALSARGWLADTNIVFTMDHGKVDTHNQVSFGSHGKNGSMEADGQLGALVMAQGAALGITTSDYAVLNEDGDVLVYARAPGAGTPAGADRQAAITQALLTLIQSGAIVGLDTTRTLTAAGAMGTRRFHDFRGSGPNQADIIAFPKADWTLNQVDAALPPGPFHADTQEPYGRHGGFSVDELYVPLIMAGPAFKQGVLLPHPVDHPQVAPTALGTLPGVALRTAAAGPISAALVGNENETVPQAAALDLASAREQVLRGSGYLGAFALPAAAATAAIVVDVAGLYEDEIFVDSDAGVAAAAAPLRALADRGTRFADFWLRYQDWPVTEYQMLTGGYPIAVPWIATAEDDPTDVVLPAAGLLAMPPPANRIANQAAFDEWRQTQVFVGETLFDAAKKLGATTALIGPIDFHDRHINAAAIDERVDADLTSAPGAVRDLLAAHPNAVAVVALGGPRTGDRHTQAAIDELTGLANAVGAIATAAPNALLVVSSRGGAPIDDPATDFYGPGSARHVPLIVVGPNVRAGVVTSQTGSAADLPATVLAGLGAATNSDFVQGTWAAGTAVNGIFQPSPASATEGRALVRAFDSAPAP